MPLRDGKSCKSPRGAEACSRAALAPGTIATAKHLCTPNGVGAKSGECKCHFSPTDSAEEPINLLLYRSKPVRGRVNIKMTPGLKQAFDFAGLDVHINAAESGI